MACGIRFATDTMINHVYTNHFLVLPVFREDAIQTRPNFALNFSFGFFAEGMLGKFGRVSLTLGPRILCRRYPSFSALVFPQGATSVQLPYLLLGVDNGRLASAHRLL